MIILVPSRNPENCYPIKYREPDPIQQINSYLKGAFCRVSSIYAFMTYSWFRLSSALLKREEKKGAKSQKFHFRKVSYLSRVAAFSEVSAPETISEKTSSAPSQSATLKSTLAFISKIRNPFNLLNSQFGHSPTLEVQLDDPKGSPTKPSFARRTWNSDHDQTLIWGAAKSDGLAPSVLTVRNDSVC